MERPLVKLSIYFFGIAGAASIFLAYVFIPKIDPTVILATTIVWRISLDIMQSFVISKRTFPDTIQLPYKTVVSDILAQILLAAFIFFTFLSHDDHFLISILLIVNLMNQIFVLPQYIKRTPRFVITQDKLIVNTFNLPERNLADLQYIEFTGWLRSVKIRFSGSLDIKLPRRSYSDAERASFIRQLLHRSPADPALDPEVIEFLNTHAPESVHGA